MITKRDVGKLVEDSAGRVGILRDLDPEWEDPSDPPNRRRKRPIAFLWSEHGAASGTPTRPPQGPPDPHSPRPRQGGSVSESPTPSRVEEHEMPKHGGGTGSGQGGSQQDDGSSGRGHGGGGSETSGGNSSDGSGPAKK
ncbi:hypothetical protein GCM10014713_17160 [Streptomyces purpureus]|uniref:Uncharacterized protein n=1 Tax=Streptomyces purpureus TaxID=1951 RepID=A0A918LMY9_9ACTN|nr:hypothetical protein GCM10014713_17160 [Streptomyces purpureus]